MTVDQILDLDEFLASAPRLAERLARFPTKPDLEADIEDLDQQLAAAAQTGDHERAVALVKQLDEIRAQFRASFRTIRLRQLSGDDWDAFRAKWRKQMESDAPIPTEMWDELVAACAVAPAMTIEQVKALAGKVGDPQLDHVRSVAWAVNTKSGVSMPPASGVSLALSRAAAAATAAGDADGVDE